MSHVLAQAAETAPIDVGATAWVLAATALVLLMGPGLALFYGGMVGSRNVLTMMMQAVVTMALVAVVWVVVGHSLAFGSSGPLIGDLRFLGMTDLNAPVPGFTGEEALSVPPVVFAGFQMMFAVVTAVLIIGAAADRWRFGAFVPFMVLWPILVYAPIAHWVFSPEGWAARTGALDFAGGTVVHVNAGAAALAVALVLGRRRGWPQPATRPHNLPFVLIGASLLWFGWFGFNAGSALDANAVAGYALVNTNAAAAAGLLGWLVVERIRYGKPTTLGAASGVVSGLVAITPCAGYIGPMAALVVGATSGALCALAVTLKSWLGYDDALDVVGVHLVAGVVGSLCVGLFASTAVNPDGADGLFAGGAYSLLGAQVITVLAVGAYAFVVTYAIGALLDRVVGNRVSAGVERAGLDLAMHGESAYTTDPPLVPVRAPQASAEPGPNGAANGSGNGYGTPGRRPAHARPDAGMRRYPDGGEPR
ncbi:MAG TPA: ammonium transporter [Pseudonocardia sp.]|nr:ammonium transporter [Pseudonocardia sp.]